MLWHPTRLCSPGPHGLVAVLEAPRLTIRSSSRGGAPIRTIHLDATFASRCRHLRWYRARPPDAEAPLQRLLLADDDTVHAYDVQDAKWHATISHASGGTGRIAHVDFGHTADEVFVYTDFGLKATLWSLHSGLGVELRDPKAPATRCSSFRETTGHLALLTRPASKDIVTILEPGSREVASCFSPVTADAQGMQWSPDGRWLAVWDAASAGFSVLVYTADGQLYKTYAGAEDAENPGLGVNRVEWDPEGRYLMVATNDARVILLGTKTFNSLAILHYPSSISSGHAQIHEEQVAPDSSRTYALSSRSAAPPSNPMATGFAQLIPSPSLDLLASTPASTPTTVWIHSLHPTPQLTAVLIHHSPIKSISWHPALPGLLLIHCTSSSAPSVSNSTGARSSNESVAYIRAWSYHLPAPAIVPVRLPHPSPVTSLSWVRSPSAPRVLLGTPTACATVSILGTDDEAEGNLATPRAPKMPAMPATAGRTPVPIVGYGPEDAFDEDVSMDFSPVKLDTGQLTRTLGFGFGPAGTGDDEADDTFEYKKVVKARG